jgi:hypothetical protein
MRYHSREVFSAFADALLQERCSGRVRKGSRSSWPKSQSESWVISPSHLGHTKIRARGGGRINGDGAGAWGRTDRARAACSSEARCGERPATHAERGTPLCRRQA